MAKPWEKIKIKTDTGEEKDASVPLIISASRSTDIPAFYSKWFMERLDRGNLAWTNPFKDDELIIKLFRLEKEKP